MKNSRRIVLYAAWYFGGVTKAAARLGYRTPTALYTRLYAYEREVGEPLWVRRSGFQLTTAGQTAVAHYAHLHECLAPAGLVEWLRLAIRMRQATWRGYGYTD